MEVEEVWRYQDAPDDAAENFIHGVAVLSEGSFVVGGDTYGSWKGSNAGDKDLVAVKIASNGTFLWAWQAGSTGEDRVRAVVALDDDSSVIAGSLNGSWNGGPWWGLEDFVAVKLHSNGTTLWSWQASWLMATDKHQAGSIVAGFTADFCDPFTCHGGVLTQEEVSLEGTDANDYIKTAAVTTNGNIVLAGYTNGSWGGPHNGFFEAAAVWLDASGTVLSRWQNGTDGTGDVYICGSAARPDGSVVLVGYTFGIWHGELEPEGASDFVAMALDQDGGELWRWQDGSDGNDGLLTAAALTNGSVVLAGYTEGNWSGNNQGEKDFAAIKLDFEGMEEWRWQDGTDADDEWEAAALGTDGSIILAGYTEGSWKVDSEGKRDMAALSLNTDGERVLWSYQEGTTEKDDINAVTVKADGTVLLAGWTEGSWEIADSDTLADFAAVLLDTGAPATTPSPTTVEPAITPQPTTLEPAITPQPTALEPATTPSPTTLKPARTPQPTTLEPAITPQPTALEPATIQPSPVRPSSNAPVVVSASSSGSSAGLDPLIIGGVAVVGVSLALIGVCRYRRRNATRTVAIPVPPDQEEAWFYPQAITPPSANTVPAEQEETCLYPQAITPPSKPPPPYTESP